MIVARDCLSLLRKEEEKDDGLGSDFCGSRSRQLAAVIHDSKVRIAESSLKMK